MSKRLPLETKNTLQIRKGEAQVLSFTGTAHAYLLKISMIVKRYFIPFIKFSKRSHINQITGPCIINPISNDWPFMNIQNIEYFI